MGQAKLRKAEIDQLKATGSKNSHWRAPYVAMIKEDQQAYMNALLACGSNLKAARKIMEDGTNIQRAVYVGTRLVQSGVATVAQVKDAAWEGFNGLLEACAVEMNIQHQLGLPVNQPNVNDFIITGPDAMQQAQARGWF